MELKLHETIKRFRKEKNLTQEKLAEALGVTVGAVSKWENGINTPDIMMLMVIADYFDVSVDVLLEHEMSLKNADAYVNKINTFIIEHNFEEAEAVSRDALTRYPYDFSVIYASAQIYHSKAIEKHSIEDAKMAIDLLTRSLNYISQNKNPDINEFVIRTEIAYDYMIIDSKVALEKIKEINFAGIHDTIIALIYLYNSEHDEALRYSTSGMINHFTELINSSTYMIVSLICKGSKKNIDSAIIIADTILEMMEKFSKDEIGYFSKIEAFYYAFKAYLYACLGDDVMMERFVSEGMKLAKKFDESGSNSIVKHMRFSFIDIDTFPYNDSIGDKAVVGIESAFRDQLMKVSGINKKALKRFITCWEGKV
ncbi:MAG: helix-turn-helix transcriptional regulator [Eubacterium sp.]|nr:helix-turn-helix transcriptional regulator [Eubacterium sp.]